MGYPANFWHCIFSVFIRFILFSICHLEMLVLLSCPTVICLRYLKEQRGKNRGVPLHSSHSDTKQGEIKFTVSEYHTVTSDFNAHRGIKRDYLDSMVDTSQPLATLCAEETGLVGSKKKRKQIPNTECVTVSSALLPSNPSCSCSAACPLPLLPTPLHWGSPLQMHQFKMACLFSREGTRPTLSR